jgi:SPP1 family predicted phage head-tail adaptor
MKCVDFVSNAKNRALVESQSLTTDELGGHSNVWTTVGTYWAWVQPLTSREQEINEQLRGKTTHKIIVRYQSGLADVKETASYRIILDNRIHEVRGIKNFDADLKGYGKVYQEILTEENAVVEGEYTIVNQIENVQAAFSLRLVNQNYTGSAVRIKRDQDEVEADIGFDVNGVFDEDAYTAHLEGSSPVSTIGYVTTWYDQSGNGLDATASDDYQPTMLLTGINSLPSIEFDGANTALSLGNNLGGFISGSSAQYDMLMTWRLDSFDESQYVFGKTGNDTDNPFTSNLRGPSLLVLGSESRAEYLSRAGDGTNLLRLSYVPSLASQVSHISVDLTEATAADRVDISTDNAAESLTLQNSGTGEYTDQDTEFWIGNRGPLASGDALEGGISEFIFISDNLTASEASIASSNAVSYWGIS